MTPAHPTRELATALAAARITDLDAATIDHTERAVLDWLGSAIAGSVEPPATMAHAVARAFGSSSEATMFAGGRGSAAAAALANGVASHILELDDIHKTSTVHGGRADRVRGARGGRARACVRRAVPDRGCGRLRSGVSNRRSGESQPLSLLASDRDRRNVRCRGGRRLDPRVDCGADAARPRHRRDAGGRPVGVQRRRRHEQAPASGEGGDEWRHRGGPCPRRFHRRQPDPRGRARLHPCDERGRQICRA